MSSLGFALSFAWEQGSPPLDEWRGQPDVQKPDILVLDLACASCGAVASAMRMVAETAYRDFDGLLESAERVSREEAEGLERCACGGEWRGLASYHTFNSALGRDLIIQSAIGRPSYFRQSTRLRKPDLWSWTLDGGYQRASDADLRRATGSVADDSARRRLDEAFSASRSAPDVIAAIERAVSRLGLAVLEPYVEGFLRYTSHPLDSEVNDPATGTEEELSVRQKIEDVAAAEARSGRVDDRVLYARIVRLRVELGQRPGSALEAPRQLLLAALEADGLGDPERWDLQAECALAYRASGDPDAAVALYRQMMIEFPDDVAAPFNLGLLALDPFDADLATEIATSLETNRAAWDGDPSYALLLARLLLKLDRKDDARRALEEARSCEPSILQLDQVQALPEYLDLLRLVDAGEGI
jgi:hypothetical protein